jgi:hypothetical protein
MRKELEDSRRNRIPEVLRLLLPKGSALASLRELIFSKAH